MCSTVYLAISVIRSLEPITAVLGGGGEEGRKFVSGLRQRNKCPSAPIFVSADGLG